MRIRKKGQDAERFLAGDVFFLYSVFHPSRIQRKSNLSDIARDSQQTGIALFPYIRLGDHSQHMFSIYQ